MNQTDVSKSIQDLENQLKAMQSQVNQLVESNEGGNVDASSDQVSQYANEIQALQENLNNLKSQINLNEGHIEASQTETLTDNATNAELNNTAGNSDTTVAYNAAGTQFVQNNSNNYYPNGVQQNANYVQNNVYNQYNRIIQPVQYNPRYPNNRYVYANNRGYVQTGQYYNANRNYVQNNAYTNRIVNNPNPAPTGNPYYRTPVNGARFNNYPANNIPTNNIPTNNIPANSIPVNNIPVNNYPANNLQAGNVDMEKTFGKSVMGIIASALIFISLVLFATIMMPYFTNTVKLISLYVVSFAFTLVGLIFLLRGRNNSLWVSILACGMGSLYITLFLSNAYFKVFDELLLYSLLLLWVVCICLLSRFKSMIFTAIGYAGISISVMFGSTLILGHRSRSLLLLLVIYYFVAMAALEIAHRQKDFVVNIVSKITCSVCEFIIVLCLTCRGNYDVKTVVAGIVLITLVLIRTILEAFLAKTAIFSFTLSVNFWIIILSLAAIIDDRQIKNCLFIAFALIYLVIAELRNWDNHKAGKITLFFMAITITVGAIDNMELIAPSIGYSILAIVLILFGGYRYNLFYKYSGFVLLGLALTAEWNNFVVCLLMVVLAIIAIYLSLSFRQKKWGIAAYDPVYRPLSYIAIIISILGIWEHFNTISHFRIGSYSYDVSILLLLFIIAFINTIVVKTNIFEFAFRNKEKITICRARNNLMLCGIIINAMLMMMVTIFMIATKHDLPHYLSIVLALVIYSIYSISLLKQKNGLTCYVGIKYTVLLLFILLSFNAPNVAISITLFVVALVSIIIGFAIKTKPLRIFGLVLAMISIGKLVLIDITYVNTLGRAISFFVGGIVCFGISIVYNIVDHKIDKK